MSHLKAQYLQGFQGFEKTFLPNFYQKAVKINLERDSVSRVDCFELIFKAVFLRLMDLKIILIIKLS